MNEEKLIVIINEIYFVINQIVKRCEYLDKRLNELENNKAVRIT